MPTYLFKCLMCKKEIEVERKIKDAGKRYRCKYCKGETKKLIVPTTFRLAGGGWASDGYSRRNG